MEPRRFLVAPASFKGSLSPTVAAAAMARGLDGRPNEICPLADGGEGTLDVIRASLGGELRSVPSVGSDGRPRDARLLQRPDGVVTVESADLIGLGRVDEARRDLARLTTRGLAAPLEAALVAGPVELGLGGSGTVDGGAGLLDALHARHGERWRFPRSVRALCDVDAPLLGPTGARRFMPQKGARPDALDALEARLAAVAARFPAVDPMTPGAGAAGGLGFALLVLGAELVPGAERVAELTGLDEKIARADVILTGEGRLDAQTLQGKAISALVRRAGGRPIAAFCGSATLRRAELARFGIARVHELGPPAPDPGGALEAAVRARTPELLAL